MPVLWEIDPTSEDATNVPVSLTDATIRLLEMDISPPNVEPLFATSADTEGDPFIGSRHRNRTITLTLLAKGTTDALTQTAVNNVQQKVDKLRREGGTVKFTSTAGTVLIGDVLFAGITPEFGKELYLLNKAVKFTVNLECKPYFRGAPVLLSDHVETTLPYLVFTETGITGDVSALGKLVVDNDDASNDQDWMIWGIETNAQYDTSAATAALFYQAEGRTALSGTSAVAGPSGASGSGSNVMRNTGLNTAYQAILSSQATGGGAHLSHVGTFRVFVRVQTPTTNTGAVSIRLEWSEADYARTVQNAPVTFPVDSWDGSWRLVDLGLVNLAKVAQGTQRWEARILAKSTVSGDDIDLDYLMLVPSDAGSGRVSASSQIPAPLTFSARDEFDQTAGALAGKVAPLGGTWTFLSGDTDDFTVDTTNHRIARSTVNDTAFRFNYMGTASLSSTIAQVDCYADARAFSHPITHFLLFRIVDSSNFAYIQWGGSTEAGGNLYIAKVIAGGGATAIAYKLGIGSGIPIPGPTWRTLRVKVQANGQVDVWIFAQGTQPGSTPILTGVDSVLATGGTIASGKIGVGDYSGVGTAYNRYYDNVLAWVPEASDAAIFASRSLEVRHDRVIRADSGGTVWQSPIYEGDYLRVPPAGKESRTVRMIVKACRSDPTTGADSAIDDISARLTYTPRFLVLGT